jgi:hypothetical protein
MPRAKHNPELTMGGSREAEMAVPTIALNPPLDTARITATPEGAATMNPTIKLITERRGDESGRREGAKESVARTFPTRLHLIALEALVNKGTGTEAHDQTSEQRDKDPSGFIPDASRDDLALVGGETKGHREDRSHQRGH